ncbi:alpha/beta hydrolase [Thiospirochaeta perfilievii]|uniref:Alpha/beta hydrolase n=1 Tax=Thiospirochaeta perfilievii TaxID=252967 RepID=A0A5C1QA92_9SPIO|nr:alpha/beta family hydrolase [Thiospirochaeta perfilievii]QEN03716.1 alpha/beta hydrolase [Thiospirochaeta perfilievii]
MKKIKILLLIIFTISIYSCSSAPVFDEKKLPTDVIINTINGGFSVIPQCYTMEKGLIFYPGGLVEPEAYIPLMARIAKEVNIAVFIKSMPFNLAVLNSNGANKILDEYNYIKEWYIAGHSLGGAMAASYVYDNPEVFKGLILLAAYPMDKKPLTDVDVKVLSIKGSQDGLVDNSEFELSKQNLPKTAQFVIINGGNHAQFGSYGEQKGDNPATISREEQQMISVKKIKELIFSSSI